MWAVTEAGRHVEIDRLPELHSEYNWQARERSRQRKREDPPADDGTADETRHWKDELLDLLLKAPPDRFERLARRLLREAGFINTTVTGKSGDGGVDGLGTYRVSLIGFNVSSNASATPEASEQVPLGIFEAR